MRGFAHKWLFQPFEMGCILVRDKRLLRDTFHILPDYLKDTERGDEDVNFCEYGIQLTRRFRTLKLWMTIKIFGSNAVRQAIEKGLENAHYAAELLRSRPGWKVVSPQQMGIVAFRYAPASLSDLECDDLNLKLVEALIRDGFAFVSSSNLKGRTILRLCPINPRTTRQDLEETIQRLDDYARTARL